MLLTNIWFCYFKVDLIIYLLEQFGDNHMKHILWSFIEYFSQVHGRGDRETKYFIYIYLQAFWEVEKFIPIK